MATESLVVEHQELAQAWLGVDQIQVADLRRLLLDYRGQCTMDYPENRLEDYRKALARALAANRRYVQWLATQGIPFR